MDSAQSQSIPQTRIRLQYQVSPDSPVVDLGWTDVTPPKQED